MPAPKTSAKPAPTRYQELLDIATELFSEHGYERTTVRMIADRMGILSGSLYSHVSRKDELLRDVALRVGETFLEQARSAAAAAETPEAALRAIARSHVRVLHEHRTAVTVYFNEWRRLDEASREQIVALRRQYEALVTAAVRAGVEDGTFEVKDVRAAVLVILSSLNWTYQWYRAEGRFGPDAIAKRYLDVILQGLLRRD